MGLRAVEGYPGMFKNPDTGQMYDFKDFRQVERVHPYPRGRRFAITTSCVETLILNRWSFVVHPWHEVIDPSLHVSLMVNHYIVAHDVPLFRIAEPLRREEKSDLEKRIENIEKAMNLRVPQKQSWQLSAEVVPPQSVVEVIIKGDADALGHLQEMTKHFLLSLSGYSRVLVS